MDFSYTTITLEQLLAEFENNLKGPSCVPCCFEDLVGGWTTDTFKQIIVKITKNARIPLPLIVYEPSQLSFLSNKQNCLEEIFKLFDTRGLNRIDLLEVLASIALTTSGTLEGKLMNAFLIFGFKDSGTLNIEEAYIFIDSLIRGICKVALRNMDTFYPRHPNFRLAPQEIDSIVNTIFTKGKNITVKEFEEKLKRENRPLTRVIMLFHTRFQESVEHMRAIMVDRIKLIPIIKSLLYNHIFTPAMAQV
jgi:hypothetical protein